MILFSYLPVLLIYDKKVTKSDSCKVISKQKSLMRVSSPHGKSLNDASKSSEAARCEPQS